MAQTAQPENDPGDPKPAEGTRARAGEILRSGKPREHIRRELAELREAELLQLMHQAAVMDASPFWREIALRRFIRTKGAADGR